MARPTANVLILLELLQSGSIRTVAELADRLGVDERTVRRYADHLADLDVPVESVRGRYGGYRLAAGYRLPPLMLSDEEALAVLLGLIAGRRTGLATTAGTASETAAAKIRRILPERLARRLDAALTSLAFTATPGEFPAPQAAVLLCVADAVRHHRPVSIRYTAAAAGPVSAPCTRTGSSRIRDGGTLPARIPGSARTAPSGWIALPAPGRCLVRSSRPQDSIRPSTSCRDWPRLPTSTKLSCRFRGPPSRSAPGCRPASRPSRSPRRRQARSRKPGPGSASDCGPSSSTGSRPCSHRSTGRSSSSDRTNSVSWSPHWPALAASAANLPET